MPQAKVALVLVALTEKFADSSEHPGELGQLGQPGEPGQPQNKNQKQKPQANNKIQKK